MRSMRWAMAFGGAVWIGLLAAGCEKPVPTNSGGPSAGSGDSSRRAQPSAGAPPATQSAEELKNLAAMVRGDGAVPQSAPNAASAPVPRVSGVPVPAAPASPVTMTMPEGWATKPPTSAMRRADYLIPVAEGDSEACDAALFYFGPGDGGDVQANMTRWRGMFTTSEGQPLAEGAGKVEKFKAGELPVTVVEFEGRYTASRMGPAAPAGKPKDDFVLLGAVIETPGANYYFRAVGPRKTMQAQREAMMGMLKSAKQP